MTRIIATAVHGKREEWVSYLRSRLPTLEIVYDSVGSAYHTFLDSLAKQGDDSAIHIEDDVILTQNFMSKAESVIKERPNTLIQFFSMRKDDLIVGSRLDRNFCMNQCTYIPAAYAPEILLFGQQYQLLPTDTAPYDTMMNAWLKMKRQPYWIHVPSLVQHRVLKSLIDPRRSSKRQSKTFVDADED